MELKGYLVGCYVLFGALLVGQLVFGNLVTFLAGYVAVFLFALVRTWSMGARKRFKGGLTAAYAVALGVQVVFCVQVIFPEGAVFQDAPFRRAFGVLLLLLPLVVSRYVAVGKYAQFYLPSLQDLSAVSFAQLQRKARQAAQAADSLHQAEESLCLENWREVLEDLPRHNSFRYINNGSLTEEYFQEARRHLEDPHLYLVLSCTGSPASEILSVFTQRQYNHASLSFDRELRTILSYNGGERLYPPGLNREMLAFFHKKPGASILVYALECTREQKAGVLARVEQINREGSAYNMIGLVFKFSHKPNIMFCSQFVYRMLELEGLAYFTKGDGDVKPTDLVELDYHRKLAFVTEIRFGEAHSRLPTG